MFFCKMLFLILYSIFVKNKKLMLAIQLFIIFTIVSIIYLVLLQYTKFFNYPPYLVKMSLNLHFYFTIIYIICFLISLIVLFVDWFTSTMVEIILQTFPYSPYSPTSPADMPHVLTDENGKSLTKLNTSENLPKNPDTAAHIAIEETKGTRTGFSILFHWIKNPISSVQHEIQHQVSEKLVDALKKPGCTAGHPEMLKASLEGMSTGKQHPLYSGPYTPEQINIKDLNDDPTLSVPFFKQTIVNSETGSSETFECYNMRKSVNVYTEKYEDVNGTPRFAKLETAVINTSLSTIGWDKTLCIKIDPDAEKLLTQESIKTLSENSFSPKGLWDPSN